MQIGLGNQRESFCQQQPLPSPFCMASHGQEEEYRLESQTPPVKHQIGGNMASQNLADSVSYHTRPPCHSKYALYTDRIKTYKTWPTHLNQKPHDLAAAAFFYSGEGDIVTCYSCGGSLKEWEPTDDPLSEHANWFPGCQFILQKRGGNFVHQWMTREAANVTDSTGSGQSSAGNVKQILGTPAAQSLSVMGYKEEMVVQAIEIYLKSGKSSDVSAQKLMEIIFEIEEKENEKETTKSLTDKENNEVELCSVAVAKISENMDSGFYNDNQEMFNDNQKKHHYMQCTEAPFTRTLPEQQQSLLFSAIQQPYTASDSKELTDPLKQLSLQDPAEMSVKSGSSSDDVYALMEENKKLRDRNLCKVCLDNNTCVVFLPCGHLCTCEKCASALRNCPLCRQCVYGTVKVFLA